MLANITPTLRDALSVRYSISFSIFFVCFPLPQEKTGCKSHPDFKEGNGFGCDAIRVATTT